MLLRFLWIALDSVRLIFYFYNSPLLKISNLILTADGSTTTYASLVKSSAVKFTCLNVLGVVVDTF